ncbi:DUF2536 family protein [Alkalihalobacillus sp. LMS39]|uniref:DUF2536 family protein n=1 Tax=Alkalihalobacillus sp. LMS39 TaxID=2924032 RepID=UPI001FB40940|nr:DUF2536 family protein [Alkalihalobacillus sp. LMS39]UOE95586.1 YrzA family protein [Alkalihalobacillus sp. LMS39]
MLNLERIDDKIELFEAESIAKLEQQINEQIENNKVLLLHVHSIHHHVHIHPQTGSTLYSAVVHFKAK